MNLLEIRHNLHAHPQVRFEETYASELIQRELTALGIEFKAGLAKGTGVLGYLPATSNPESAPTIALRADIDALPIHEETGKPYASTIPGRMHACGHDGHTTILLGVAHALVNTAERPNNVLMVFQPAEEGGAGGDLMVKDGCLSGTLLGKKADMMFGLHGWTTVQIGHVATKVGAMMASTDEFFVEKRIEKKMNLLRKSDLIFEKINYIILILPPINLYITFNLECIFCLNFFIHTLHTFFHGNKLLAYALRINILFMSSFPLVHFSLLVNIDTNCYIFPPSKK